jgi:single-strand DNA-binding protein
MSATNKWLGIGRLTKDPDVRYSEEGKITVRYTLAVNRKRVNGQQEADFISCVVFGKQGEFAEKYLRKGSKVAVSGRIQTGSYTNREGQKVYTTDIVVEEQEFVEAKNADSSQTSQNQNNGGYTPRGNNYTPKPTNSYRNDSDAFKKDSVGDGFMQIPADVDDAGLPWN